MLRIKSFKHSIILSFILATFIPLMFIGYFGYSYLSFKISESGQRNNELLADAVAAEIKSYMREPLTVLRQISVLLDVHNHTDDEINEMLDLFVTDSDFLEAIYVLDENKKIENIGLSIDNTSARENYLSFDLSSMEIFRNLNFLQGPFWSKTYFSPIADKKSLALIFPTENQRYIIWQFAMSELHKVISSRSSQRTTSIIVLDDSGKPIFHPQMNIVEEQLSFSNLLPYREAQIGNFGTYEFTMGETRYIGSTANIAEAKWLVIVAQQLEIARQPVRNIANFYILVVIIAGFVVAAIALRQSRRLLRPLKQLEEKIQAVSEGDYQKEQSSYGLHEEFEKVTIHFHEMANTIEKREQLLEINEERLVSLLEIHNLKHLTEDKLLEFALEQAVNLTRSEIGYMHYLDAHEKSSARTLWSSDADVFYSEYSLSIKDLEEAKLWHDSIDQRENVVKNTQKSNRNNDQEALPPSVLRQLSVPIFDGEKMVAVVGVLNKRTNYDTTDARQLSLYFNHTWDILQQKRSERDRERLMEQLAQAQKLEAIGTLAGGIAHDFNNVLMVIIGNTEMARESIDDQDKVSKDLDEIFKAALRARDLVNQILAFSRNKAEGLKPLDIRPIVKEAVKLLRSSLPANIEINQSIAAEVKQVISEPGQINQLIMNLCTNAYQAMEGGPGRLDVELRQIVMEKDLFDRGKMVAIAGEYVQLVIKDSGKGIPDHLLNRIFEPYYTTREKERGTGLGLAVVHGIVKSLKGAILVESKAGTGTEFTIYLPVLQVEESPEQNVLAAALPGGNERILYVDDDESVAVVNSKILESLGYGVSTFTSSVDALDFFIANQDDIDLIITDMAMPELTGDLLAEKILSVRDQMPIILCTGYSEQIDNARAEQIGIQELILKPLTKIDLALTVRKVLGFSSFH